MTHLRLFSFGALLGAVLSVGAACGPIAIGGSKCSPSSCGGCCDAVGKCQSGATSIACGLNGVACVECPTGQACNAAGLCGSTSSGGTGGGTGGTATGGGTGGTATGGGSGGTATGGGTGGTATGGGTGGSATGGGTGGTATGGGTGGTATGGGTGGSTGGGTGGATGGGTGGGTGGAGGSGDGGIPWNTSGVTGQLWMSGDLLVAGTYQYVHQVLPSTVSVGVSQAGRKTGSVTTSADGLVAVVEYPATTSVAGELVMMNADGSNVVSLGAIPAGNYVYDLAISPNRAWVAYSRGNAGTTGLDLFAQALSSGSAPVQISPVRGAGTNTLQPSTWTWSANSRYLAVTGDYVTNGKYELHLIDFQNASAPVDTVLQADASLSGKGVGDVFWKDASTLVARVQSSTQATARLCTCTLAGACTQIANSPGTASVGVGTVAVTPNGATAVFTANLQNATTWDLFRMPTDGSSAPVQLLPNAPTGRTTQGGSLRISPDGTKVAFNASYASAAAGTFDVYVQPIASTASAFAPLLAGTATQNVVQAAWAPQSSVLALLGDLRVDNQLEVYVLRDFVTLGQTPQPAHVPPLGGDVATLQWTP